MPLTNAFDWVPVAVAFVACLLLTPLVRGLSRRYGAVAQPRRDRWHQTPTALLGGIAIFVSVTATCLIFLPHARELLRLAERADASVRPGQRALRVDVVNRRVASRSRNVNPCARTCARSLRSRKRTSAPLNASRAP